MRNRCVHLFPFEPWGVDGGTLRLRTAIEASTRLFEHVDLFYWDGVEWLRGHPGDVTSSNPGSARVFATDSLKRRVFPSTLWESGLKATKTFDVDALDRTDTVVVHSTYLGGLVRTLRTSVHQARIVLDVYDLVWRVHQLDANLTGRRDYRLARRLYSAIVRPREESALRLADAVACAGWTDLQHLPDSLEHAIWAPTGLDVSSAELPATGPLRVGMIGSFSHSATVDAAESLVSLQASLATPFTVVVAGAFSDEWAEGRDNVVALGRVDDIAEFYREVHACVVPVGNGSGMKCKLAESILAGRPVITTPAGAEGFPETLSRFFAVDPRCTFDEPTVRALLDKSAEAQSAFRSVEREVAAATYASLL